MSEELNPDNKLSPQELAKHLRRPEGETGKAVGIQMNKGNKHICLNSYKILNAQDGERILEIGMGNGYFISDLFQMADNIKYIGLDFSPTMIEEAKNINQATYPTFQMAEVFEAEDRYDQIISCVEFKMFLSNKIVLS